VGEEEEEEVMGGVWMKANEGIREGKLKNSND
jgi:hypothetical protein